MKKKLLAVISAIVLTLALTSLSAFAEETELPAYDTHILDRAELDELFSEENFTYEEGAQNFVARVYQNIINPEATVYGVNFTATESFEEADAKAYGDYIVDFGLSADEPVTVILAGNYGEYGTIVIGAVNLTSEPVRIMQLFDKFTGKGKLTYKEVVNMVGSFDCAAIPVSSELIKAYYSAKCETDASFKAAYPAYSLGAIEAVKAEILDKFNPAETESIITAENTTVSLSLNLYENDPAGGKYDETGKSWTVGEPTAFTYAKDTSEDPVISKDFLIIHNMENVTKNDKTYHPVRIYTGIDTLECDNVGFEITVQGGGNSENQTASTTTVYSTMNVTDSKGSESVYTADTFGSEYMFGAELLFDAEKWTNENATISVTPYAAKYDGTIVKGITSTITNALIEEKTEGSSLFREE